MGCEMVTGGLACGGAIEDYAAFVKVILCCKTL